MTPPSDFNPLIMLDIDGVMNTTLSALRHRSGEVFAAEPIIALRWLLTKTGAQVVVTSTRRRAGLAAMRSIFIRNQLADLADRIVGHTPILTESDTDEWREEEITLWLEAHTCNSAQVVILDDKAFSGPLARRLICTDADFGLTLEMARLAAAKIKSRKLPL